MKEKLYQNKKYKKQSHSELLKYSAIAFEWFFSMIFMAWIGIKLDKKFNLKYPIFLSVLTLFILIVNIVGLIKKVNK